MQLALVGRVKKEDFSKAGKTNLEILREYVRYSSVRRYSLSKSVFEAGKAKYSFLLDYMGLELEQCSSENMKAVRMAAVGKKPWPEPESVFIHDNIVVVILSPVEE